jgi:hypothetical protein
MMSKCLIHRKLGITLAVHPLAEQHISSTTHLKSKHVKFHLKQNHLHMPAASAGGREPVDAGGVRRGDGAYVDECWLLVLAAGRWRR